MAAALAFYILSALFFDNFVINNIVETATSRHDEG
ncbi:protein ECHIDNA-like protein [Corchorus olitorius]|uniref:Protein ECHIDNA-like protein n=1 Tax=Corchorus olitorius TaxID=93759 RepID=A0A1R3IAU8_9ROSI|nr:protein ECHIDNA-like protein [Corchorus olitorius]